MSLRRLQIALCLLTGLAATTRAQGGGAEKDVLAVVHRLFEGMRTADSGMVRSTMAPVVRFASLNTRKTPPAIESDSVDGWVRAIAGSNRRWDEQIYDVQVRVDDNMAQVWAPYTFYLDRKLSHCGIDGFDLLKDATGWKITQLSDTRRRENCRDVLK
jgi:hypothetical protein